MIWHAFNVKRGLSLEYRRIPKAVRADHHTLLLFCAQLENGGVIRDAGAFTDEEWLLLGFRTSDVDALVSFGLARWERSPQLPLVAAKPDPGIHDGIRQNGPGSGSRDPISASNDGSRQDPGIHDGIRYFRGCDLVLVDYDVGGEERNRELSDAGLKGAISRWKEPEQRPLPFPPTPLSGGSPPGAGIHDGIRQKTGSRDPAIGQAIGQANARHGTERHEDPPPTPSPEGGGRSFVRHPSRTAWLRFEAFWTWLQEARPRQVDRRKWSGAKNRARYVIWRQAAERARLVKEREPCDEDVLELLDLARQDLSTKFKDARWLRLALEERWSIVGYFSQEDYNVPLERQVPDLQVVEDPEATKRRAAAAATEEAELRVTWSEEMVGEDWPGDLEVAKRRLRKKHGWVQ